MVYKVTWSDADGVQSVEFVDDIGAYRMLKATIIGNGGEVKKAIQVPRAMMVESQAKQAAGL